MQFLTTAFLLFLGSTTVLAQQEDNKPKPEIIFSNSNQKVNPAKYSYLGCYNETTSLEGTTGERALYGGINLVEAADVGAQGQGKGMTVEKCWEFCAKNGTYEYKYAGLEYARECWCSTTLNSLSEKVDDSACDLPCEGNTTQVCGGNLKLTIYMAGSGRHEIARWTGAVVVMAVVGVVSSLI
ncbi:WSC domain-containing protein [Podospora fimiseda]|uniref:WSC domain-containing protein n=1 Tax=Podospora fimiseda TaxID=252190 RepID=A0AAN7BMM2_9PEZI|nr:WSC domain-containing protein [Podospora fimiseda]